MKAPALNREGVYLQAHLGQPLRRHDGIRGIPDDVGHVASDDRHTSEETLDEQRAVSIAAGTRPESASRTARPLFE